MGTGSRRRLGSGSPEARPRRPWLWALLLIALPLGAAPGGSQEGTPPTGPPGSAEAYGLYTEFLQDHVREGRLDYAALDGQGAPRLERFLDWLAFTDPADFDSPEAQMALWINAYNACTIKGVLDRYPLKSVRDVGLLGGLIGGFFKKDFCRVGDRRYSLDDIEKGILLTRFQEPRIHWTLSCASLSCPDLRREAYMAERLYQQMDDQGRKFLNSPKAFRVDREARKIYLSRYFDWYREDFVRAAGSIEAYLAPWLTPDRRLLLEDLAPEIKFLDYDWSLNER